MTYLHSSGTEQYPCSSEQPALQIAANEEKGERNTRLEIINFMKQFVSSILQNTKFPKNSSPVIIKLGQTTKMMPMTNDGNENLGRYGAILRNPSFS